VLDGPGVDLNCFFCPETVGFQGKNREFDVSRPYCHAKRAKKKIKEAI